MKGIRVGYKRVSTAEQNTERQLDGVKVDRMFVEKVSGKNMTDRPQLQEMFKFVRDGDVIVCDSMCRLARNLTDLKEIVTGLTAKGVEIEFIKERLTFDGNDSPVSQLLLNVMGAFSQFERQILLQRQAAGIEIAKRKGVYRGRKPKFTSQQAQGIAERVRQGESKASIAKELGVSRVTLYGALRQVAS